ncbi:hypothetical protein CYMTET_23950 [Cymbomonas tetramitiformis]|uniref:Uncharacterized protein n=1 Tax=Cymbomonas tetramitiformis TaxID=36881 RepID=A0AAE0L0F3_9CHLO|nr:hypothetical protein CYMTET_23950 [Cymbomonas tetramitiformis]
MGEPVAEFQDEDKKALENWEQGDEYNPTPEFRENFIKVFSCGLAKGDVNNPEAAGPAFKALFWLSGVNWFKVGSVIFVFYLIYLFLVMLALMGTGFKLLGGKDSAKMFDVVDNPISGLMIGVLATVLVQSSSTTTSIIIGLVGADEMSVETAIPMIMGANIGTSVTNTLVAMGHFANPVELRRGFAGATVHDVFNMLSVIVILPLQWASNFLGHLTYEMVKDTQVLAALSSTLDQWHLLTYRSSMCPCAESRNGTVVVTELRVLQNSAQACEEDSDTACEDQDFIKPFIKPYSSGVASYDKKIADYVAQGFCDGQCADSSSSNDKLKTATEYMCNKDEDGTYKCDGIDDFENSWLENDVLKEKRLPGYMQFKSSNIAEYFYACPIKDCNVTLGYASEFWDETSNSVNPEAAGLFNGTAQATGQVFEVCHKMKVDLCDADLLKGGIMKTDWELDDATAGILCTLLSISSICCVLYLIVQVLHVLVKGFAAKMLRRAVEFSPYFSMLVGCFITVMVQSSSITTSVLTPIVAVGLITLEQMFPLTLGANIGTCVTGLMSASVSTSNATAVSVLLSLMNANISVS